MSSVPHNMSNGDDYSVAPLPTHSTPIVDLTSDVETIPTYVLSETGGLTMPPMLGRLPSMTVPTGPMSVPADPADVRRKRGRPRKEESTKGKAPIVSDVPKRKRGRPRKFPFDTTKASTSGANHSRMVTFDEFYTTCTALEQKLNETQQENRDLKMEVKSLGYAVRVLEETVDRLLEERT